MQAFSAFFMKFCLALMENDPVEEKLLFAEYAIDFAMQAADRALLISMEATEAEQAKKEEKKQKTELQG